MYIISKLRKAGDATELELVVTIKTAEYDAIDKAMITVVGRPLRELLEQRLRNELLKARGMHAQVKAL